MKQLLLLLGLFISLSMAARDFKYDGIIYTVIDEANKCVETKARYSEKVNDDTKYYAGNDVTYYNLDLPAKVYDGDEEYTLTRIGDISFTGSTIFKLTLPETVTEIGFKGFSVCTWLYDVKLPEEMETVGEEAFSGCIRLTEVDLANVNTIGKMAFALCMGLEHIDIPESVKTIESQAFTMSALKSISIPHVREIGSRAFWVCANLESVQLGNDLIDLGIMAFSGCPLTKIYYNTEFPALTLKSTFDDEVYEKATLYVPASSKSTFESITPWSYFTNIQENDFSRVDNIEISDTAECEYYDLNGRRLLNPASGQIVIKRQGNKTTKIVLP